MAVTDTSHDCVDVDRLIELEVGAVAHGGHCVARHEGRVVFVRHAIPGERVRVALTESEEGARFWRGDAVEIIRPSEFRRIHQWKLADMLRAHASGRLPVGGAEFGHIVVPHQRRLKAQVYRDTLARIAGITVEPEVMFAGEDEPTGQRWRTRNAFAVTPNGRIAMHAHRSGTLVAVRNMPLGVPALDALALWDWDFSGAERVDVTTPADGGRPLVLVTPTAQTRSDEVRLGRLRTRIRQAANAHGELSTGFLLPAKRRNAPAKVERITGRTWVEETVAAAHGVTRTFRVSGDGFWQVHKDAATTLVDAVMEDAAPQPGQVVADLYAGVGLFTAFLAEAVGPGGHILSVEVAPHASRDALRNLHDLPQATVLNGPTDRVLGNLLADPDAEEQDGGLAGRTLDTVVLDPPRAGAGRRAVERIIALAPETVVYVSCDPASLARDLAWLARGGYEVTRARVIDLYPDTHHLESVTVLTRTAPAV
ncbi:SAM-dependent methyltransferase [Micrococcus sp. HMSC067E09]|uniref:class I SAM-dependent RNA methyltransferase n=1 Tax=Micrococcus sp. HMSC067E09 TaxID=1739367 RepID=UPI0008A35763|nr:TRAM domain-containing protein [Micrococcus sp. HMSC067E09]OFR90059.1 SAM-dependent methyltransferase [Micrococcus sp. HMSC067E09]